MELFDLLKKIVKTFDSSGKSVFCLQNCMRPISLPRKM